jgi:hypothetical protein
VIKACKVDPSLRDMNIPDNWIDFTSFIEKDNNLKNKYNELENFINNW